VRALRAGEGCFQLEPGSIIGQAVFMLHANDKGGLRLLKVGEQLLVI
jgi:hypothetical protein